MRSANVLIPIAIASGAAAESATVINLLGWNWPLTSIGADSKATTYEVVCPEQSGDGTSAFGAATTVISKLTPTEEATSSASNLNLAPITGLPTPTGNARLRLRQFSSDSEPCEPFTLLQGASTWEFHVTDPVPGAFTYDASCNWSGKLTAADLSCTATLSGDDIFSNQGVSTTTLKSGEINSIGALQTLPVVQPGSSSAISTGGTGGSSSSAAPTNGTLSAKPTPTASNSAKASPSAPSSALAASGPLPSSAMAFVGGAAGILVAALAL